MLLAASAMILAGCQQRAGPENSIFSVVRDNNADRVQQYLAEGGDPDLTNDQGDSLLFIASGPRGGLQVVEALLVGGADTGLTSAEGRTALHNAAGWCDVAIVETLLEAGADPMREDGEGRTPADNVCAEPADRRAAVLETLEGAGG